MSNIDRRVFLGQSTAGIAAAAGAVWLGAAGRAFGRAPAALKLCLISGSDEYKSDASLAAFQEYVAKQQLPITATLLKRKADDDLPGLEALDACDCLLLFTRRLKIAGEQLERVKKYCLSGRPLVGVRTASHAFQNWLELDREVFGGNYKGHYSEGPETEVKVAPAKVAGKAAAHPILTGFEPFTSAGSLYKNTGLSDDTQVLLTGTITEKDAATITEPLAWTREYKGARIFYTSLGHPKDFEIETFRKLLVQAILWTTKRSPEK